MFSLLVRDSNPKVDKLNISNAPTGFKLIFHFGQYQSKSAFLVIS